METGAECNLAGMGFRWAGVGWVSLKAGSTVLSSAPVGTTAALGRRATTKQESRVCFCRDQRRLGFLRGGLDALCSAPVETTAALRGRATVNGKPSLRAFPGQGRRSADVLANVLRFVAQALCADQRQPHQSLLTDRPKTRGSAPLARHCAAALRAFPTQQPTKTTAALAGKAKL